VLGVLREHQGQQEEDRRMYGPDYAELGLIFARPDGHYYNPDKVGTRVRTALRAAGLHGVSLHSLRHSHASELLSQGAPITAVAERLGHASPNITLSIYSHALPADNQRRPSCGTTPWRRSFGRAARKGRGSGCYQMLSRGSGKKP
jgi:integrase